LESVVINTSQNVVIDYEPAGLGNRLLSGILDVLFKIGFIFSLSILYSLLDIKFSNVSSPTYAIIFFVIIYLPYLLYDLLFETFMHGQTFGKKIMKIKVVKLDGTQPSVGSYLLRWLIRLVEIDMCGGLIAIVSIAVSKNSQRLGDMAAGTTVIHIKPAVTLQDTILQQEKQEAYKIVFNQITMLSDTDIQLVKDVHDFYEKTGNSDALEKLAKKIKEKTGIVTSLSNEIFFTTLLKDYNHYQLVK
jgi:uncharacterized RDD family membrane protein YckC